MIKILVMSALTGLTFSSPIFAGDVSDQITVEGVYARAVPPGLSNTAAFMTLNNADNAAHTLVSAKSPAADLAELHTHINDNGVMRMRRVDGFTVPARGSTELKPGGRHLMLIGLHRQLAPGDEIDLSLVFEDGSETRLRAPVRKITATMKCGSGKCGGGKCGGK